MSRSAVRSGQNTDIGRKGGRRRSSWAVKAAILAILAALLQPLVFTAEASAATASTIAAVGDIACATTSSQYNGGAGTPGFCQQKATSDLVAGKGYSKVLPLGDTQYDNGLLSQFQASYDPTWGRVKSITRPAPGNHEYMSTGAAGYYDYFGTSAGSRSKGYYSYNVGSWHIIALNSECAIVSCAAGSAQETWLKADLAANSNLCTLAYWHRPRWSSAEGGSATSVAPLMSALYAGGADLALTAHSHVYERFAPQNPVGGADNAYGVREITVGTGGDDHGRILSVRPNSQVRNTDTFGVLKVSLGSSSYSWNFQPVAGQSFTDSGTTNCHSAPTGGSQSTFNATDDASVDQTQPATNFGADTRLTADNNSPVSNFLVKFNVTGCATVTSATLRVTVGSSSADGSPLGGKFYTTGTSWSQSTVTWNNAPPAGTNVGSLGSVALNTTYSVNVGSAVKGNGSVAFRVSTTSSDGVRYLSKEGTTTLGKRPQLLVTCA